MKELLKKQAILDIIVTPEHDAWRRLVSYEYNRKTRCDRFRISNGSGDHLYVIFSPDGVIIKGFDHESCLSPYQNEEEQTLETIYTGVPEKLLALLDEETERNDVTFCIWQLPDETTWHQITAWEGKETPDLGRLAKGMQVYVSGRLRSFKYTNTEGQEKQLYEVVASKVKIVTEGVE